MRKGKTVARGRVSRGRVSLVSRNRLANGTYTLFAGKRKLRASVR